MKKIKGKKISILSMIMMVLTLILSMTFFYGCSKPKDPTNSSGSGGGSGSGSSSSTSNNSSSSSTPGSTTTPTLIATPTGTASVTDFCRVKDTTSCNNRLPGNPVYGNASGSSSGYCEARGLDLADQILDDDYLRIPVLTNGSLVGGVMWTSWNSNRTAPVNINTTYILEDNLKTDSTLAVRVYVKPAPRQCPLDHMPVPNNITAKNNQYNPYGSLDITVGIRNPESSSTSQWEKIVFSKVKINECSPVRYFMSVPNTNKPIIVEVLDVKSDFLCSQGYTGYCPSTNIAWLACFEIEVQVATDNTKRIPE
ncbi:MAG: hypothetical protein HQK49_01325 [Oligoflexia bacterium]|nr:hypothetical protein [Oligoflexia bacterium]